MTQKFFYLQQQKRKLHYELSKPKNLSITCPEIGNHTFTNDPPFDVLGVPKCGDKVKPEIRYDNYNTKTTNWMRRIYVDSYSFLHKN